MFFNVAIKIFLLFDTAATWKNFEFWSSADNHSSLDFCGQSTSCLLIHSHNSSWHSFSWEIVSSMGSKLWSCWILSSSSHILNLHKSKDSLFHFLKDLAVFPILFPIGILWVRLVLPSHAVLTTLMQEGSLSHISWNRKGLGSLGWSRKIFKMIGVWSDWNAFRWVTPALLNLILQSTLVITLSSHSLMFANPPFLLH